MAELALLRARAYHRHQLSAKTRKQKRNLGHSALVASVDERAIKRILLLK